MALILPRQSVYDTTPAAHPPAGEQSNLVNPPSQTTAIVHVNGIALLCMLVMLICRLWVRGRLTKNIGWDDWTCGIAAICSIAQSSLIFYDLNLKLGIHIWNIPQSFFMNPTNVQFLSSVSLVYPIVAYFVKLSILLFYSRVFGVHQVLKSTIRISIVILTIFYVTYLCVQIAIVAECTGTLQAVQYPVCQNIYSINILQSSLNVFTNLFVFLLPLRRLMALKVDKKRKIGIIVVFGAGLMIVIVSIVRLVLLALNQQSNDPWNIGLISNLSVVEINAGIMFACAPMLPRLFQRKPLGSNNLPSSPDSPGPPPPPSKERSFTPVAPPSSRIDHHSREPSPWRNPALTRALSPDREQYVELEDHYAVSPIDAGCVELAAHHPEVYHEIDAVPARGLPARWVRLSRRL